MDIHGLASALQERVPSPPEVFVVLGSGLSGLAGEVEDPVRVPFLELPGLPPTGVEGHDGAFILGRLAGRTVLLQSGRYHLYEGHPAEVVAAPTRVACLLGARSVLATNASGGIARHLGPGALLLLDDHLNLQVRSPLVGPVAEGEERFPDMSAPYDPELSSLFEGAARSLRLPVQRGVYGAVLGPSYETPAEIRMLRTMGADVVGMSTVPEVLAARARSVPVVAVSVVTNWASGITPDPLDHREVVRAGEEAAASLRSLVRKVAPRLP